MMINEDFIQIEKLHNALAAACQLTSKFLQHSHMTPSTNDLLKIEKEINIACNALAQLPITPKRSSHDLPAFGVFGSDEGYMLYTPFLPRRKGQIFQSYCTPGSMIAQVLRDANINLGTSPGFSVKMIPAYPLGTPFNRMLDPDNIASKMLIDCIAQAIEHDDGGVAMELQSANIFCDSFPQGMYTFVDPRDPAQDMIKYQERIRRTLCL